MMDSLWQFYKEEPWLYWFFDSAWWLGASQGAVGALIGFVGLFAAYKFSQRGDRERRREEQSLAGVARIMELILALDYKQPYEVTQGDVQALQSELMLFYVHHIQDRPKTALWAQRHSVLLGLGNKDQFGMGAVRAYAREIGSELTRWLRKDRREGVLDPEDCLNKWKVIHERADALRKRSEGSSDPS